MEILNVIIFLICIASYSNLIQAIKPTDENFVLVISLDGFRYDYLDKYSNKNGFLRKLAASGSRACWSDSVFPTNTYPNHWSIVTGLFPQNSGVINNHIYDPNTKETYHMYGDKETKEGWFQDSEPIWITNNKADPFKKSVVFDWPGCPAKFQNQTASVFREIETSKFHINTYNETVSEFVESIVNPKTNLGILYLGEPDMSGHMYGPDSEEVKETVQKLDLVLDYLFEQLKTKKGLVLVDSVNEEDIQKNELRFIDLVILTDHGMQNVHSENGEDPERVISLESYPDIYKYVDFKKTRNFGSLAEIWPNNYENTNSIYEAYDKLQVLNDDPRVQAVYLKKDIPDSLHVRQNRRMAPILIIMKEGYQIVSHDSYKRRGFYGNHGFDPNEATSMRGIFLAHGNSFKKSYYSKKPVKLIDVYSLLCSVLKIQPNNHDGSFNRIKHFLINKNTTFKEL